MIRRGGITPQEIAAVEERERVDLDQQAQLFRAGRPHVDVAGRTAVIVDDGIATGSTAAAACQVATRMGARRVVLAVPVGAPESLRGLRTVCDEVVSLHAPEYFMAVGTFYDNFRHVSDAEVSDLLARSAAAVKVPTASTASTSGQATTGQATTAQANTAQPDSSAETEGDRPTSGPRSSEPDFATNSAGQTLVPPERDEDVNLDVVDGTVTLEGHLTVPANATGIVIFVHGSGSSRHSPRNRYVATQLNEAGLGTLLFDLLTKEEEAERANVFDIPPMAERLTHVTSWVREQPGGADTALGYFGASTGAAAALWAGAEPGVQVDAIVSRGGRPDLADPRLHEVVSPTLLIVGGRDEVVLGLNRQAQQRLRCESRLAIVPGATHLFEEPGTLQTVTRLARDWFLDHFAQPA